MHKRMRKIMSVFCALMMVIGVLFTGTSTVLAGPAVPSERELSSNTYLRKIIGVRLERGVSRWAKEYDTLDVMSAGVEEIDIEAVPFHPKATAKVSGNNNLVGGENRISIVVTAENGVDKAEYIVIVHKRESDILSSNADLKAIHGVELNESFDKNRLSYTANISADVSYLSDFDFETEVNTAQAHVSGVYQLLNEGENPIEIHVRAEDGTKKVYSIIVTKESPKDLSSNAYLEGIYGVGLEGVFDKDRIEYTIKVPNETPYLNGMYVVAEEVTSSVSIKNEYAELQVGENLKEIKVTAEDGTEKVYLIKVIREEGKPDTENSDEGEPDASLKEIYESGLVEEPAKSETEYLEKVSNVSLKAINGIQLNEAFDKDNLVYTASVGRDVSRVDIVAQAEDENARVYINGNEDLSIGENFVSIGVFAENGAYRDYRIKINRGNASSNANIRSISGIDLDEDFSNDELSYYSLVPYEVSSLDLEVVTEDPTAEVVIEGPAKALKVGINAIQVVVTSESGLQKRVNITVDREESKVASSNANLSNIFGNIVLDQPIVDNKLSYTAKWDTGNGLSEINIKADEKAELRVSGTSADGRFLVGELVGYYQGMDTFSVENMAKGVNTLVVEVTAQDETVKTYTIKVAKE